MDADGSPFRGLSRRERQIMEVVFARGEVSVNEVRKRIPDPPTYNAVRATLRILEEKGHVVHERDGRRYVYRTSQSKSSARRGAIEHLVRTFFDGSVEDAVVTLLEAEGTEMSEGQLERLTKLIEEAKSEGR